MGNALTYPLSPCLFSNFLMARAHGSHPYPVDHGLIDATPSNKDDISENALRGVSLIIFGSPRERFLQEEVSASIGCASTMSSEHPRYAAGRCPLRCALGDDH